jgi:adenine specific DNA methylase Mod
MILDGIFRPENFRNEIIWKRTTAKSLMSRRLPDNHDILLCYQKTERATWNEEAVYVPYDSENLGKQ